jgi:uncharacterized protein (DUF952 family)
MPIKYAIRKVTSTQKVTYDEDVPHIVADMDEENGMYAIYSTNNVRLTDWIQLKASDSLQKALANGRMNPGPTLKDSIQQDINQGDYLFTHHYDQNDLELSLVVRNLKVKTEAQQLTNTRSWDDSLRKRNPEATLRIPKELIDGGPVVNEILRKGFAVQENHSTYHVVDETTASQDRAGRMGYFNSNGDLVTGWVRYSVPEQHQAYMAKKKHNNKLVMETLDTPPTDALGTELMIGDWVFSNDNQYSTFMLSEIMGFTEDKVLLLGYYRLRNSFCGQYVITWNKSKKIVKLPITV